MNVVLCIIQNLIACNDDHYRWAKLHAIILASNAVPESALHIVYLKKVSDVYRPGQKPPQY